MKHAILGGVFYVAGVLAGLSLSQAANLLRRVKGSKYLWLKT